MGMQLSDEILLANGYERFGRTAFDSKNIVCNFSKAFYDDKGRCKYRMGVHKWDISFIQERVPDGGGHEYGYEYYVQFVRKGSRKVIDMNFRSDWELWEVEDFAENMFDSEEIDFYDDPE